MIETELERIMVRLVGDGSSYQKMMEQAQETTQQASQVIEGFTNRLESFSRTASSALAAIGLGGGLAGAFGAFNEEEEALIRLRSSLRANNLDVERGTREWKDFASQVQDTTRFADEYVISLGAQAQGLRVFGATARTAVTQALALSAATGAGTGGALRVAAAMAQGDTGKAMKFSRRINELKGIKDEAEFIAEYNKLVGAGTQTMGEQAETASGKIMKMKNAMSDFLETLGAIVADAIKPVVDGLKNFSKWLSDLPEGTKKAIVAITAVTSAILLVEPVLKNLDNVLSTLTSPVDLLVGVFGAGLATFVERLGGVNKTWEFLKQKFTEAHDWIKPVIDAFQSLGQEVLDTSMYVLDAIKNLGSQSWANVTGMIRVNFEEIRASIVSFLEMIRQFIRDNREVILSLTQLAIAIGAGVVAFVAIQQAIKATLIVMSFLKVQQIISIALWAVWKIAMLAVSLVMVALNVVIAIFNFNMLIMKGIALICFVALSALTAVMGAAKIATWLWNAALLVTNALVGALPLAIVAVVAGITALIATFVMVTTAVSYAAGAVMGLFQAFTTLTNVMGSLPTTTGPIADIISTFQDAKSVLGLFIRAIRVDLNLAWDIAAAGGRLMVGRFQDMWPGVWKFLQDGFPIVWNLIALSFRAKMGEMGEYITTMYADILVNTRVINQTERDLLVQSASGVTRRLQDSLEINTRNAQRDLAELTRQIGDAPVGDMTRGARTELQRLTGLITAAEERAARVSRTVSIPGDALINRSGELGRAAGKSFNKGLKGEIAKIDGVLRGSAEALSRIAAYRDQQGLIALRGPARPGAVNAAQNRQAAIEAAQAVGQGGLLGGGGGNLFNIFGQIAANTERMANNPQVQVAPANLDDEEP